MCRLCRAGSRQSSQGEENQFSVEPSPILQPPDSCSYEYYYYTDTLPREAFTTLVTNCRSSERDLERRFTIARGLLQLKIDSNSWDISHACTCKCRVNKPWSFRMRMAPMLCQCPALHQAEASKARSEQRACVRGPSRSHFKVSSKNKVDDVDNGSGKWRPAGKTSSVKRRRVGKEKFSQWPADFVAAPVLGQ